MRLSRFCLTALAVLTLNSLRATGESALAQGTFSNPTPININDGGSPPTPATPYPSTINVSGVNGRVNKVTVTLHNLNHTFPDDVDVLLVGPAGQSALLMSDVGGFTPVGDVTLTLDDDAATLLPDNGALGSGAFRPTDSDSDLGVDSFPPPAPGGSPANSSLSVFNDTDPNGAWSLYVVDDFSADGGAFAGGWSLTLNASPVRIVNWGLSTDKLVPADYDGDGKTDVAVFRPSDSNWYILRSSTNTMQVVNWGLSDDLLVPADYDGDGKADVAVFRASEGNWYILQSSNNTMRVAYWGLNGDVPVPADYDGDGKADVAIWRPSDGNWWILNSSDNSTVAHQWGLGSLGDVTVQADYDGDGKTDLAVWRPSEGNWYIINSSTGAGTVRGWGGGSLGDIPVQADYDGDGKADLAVWRPSEGNWYVINSATNTGTVRGWGGGSLGDVPVPEDYDGDGKADVTVFRPSESNWYILQSSRLL
ncbi:MAG TPA: VCBS repeat-containing protein [Pyrinomonadaceae bacterium]|nr:VCBS repeat-containing protein [Pyrinomonadaceae bacterium]